MSNTRRHNDLHIISKYPDQTWESWFKRFKKDDEVSIPWNWKYDKARQTMKRLRKKKYFKQYSAKGMDHFIRTSKEFVPGDNPNKAISFSKTENKTQDNGHSITTEVTERVL